MSNQFEAEIKAASGNFEIVAIGTSLGGIRAVSRVLALLPSNFQASVVLTQHLSPHYRSELTSILNRHSTLPVKWAEHGEKLFPTTVYVAPPDKHLLVNPDGTLSLSQSEPVSFCRPSVTSLFESVAYSYGQRAIGVTLTGLGQDGALGVQVIKEQGGRVLAQNKESCEAFGMPNAAIRTGCVDFVLPLDEIANALTTLVMVNGAVKVSPPPLWNYSKKGQEINPDFPYSCLAEN